MINNINFIQLSIIYTIILRYKIFLILICFYLFYIYKIEKKNQIKNVISNPKIKDINILELYNININLLKTF